MCLCRVILALNRNTPTEVSITAQTLSDSGSDLRMRLVSFSITASQHTYLVSNPLLIVSLYDSYRSGRYLIPRLPAFFATRPKTVLIALSS